MHKQHADAAFCTATINYLEELASIMGPEQVFFLSQDDKARVPIGITAANKQAPMLMHVDYRVKLPDHDWVVAERHKLIPSVYGVMEVKSDMRGDRRAVSYSGPTYIVVRSGKHCSSTATSHGRDFDTLMSDQEFLQFTRMEDGGVKPVVIVIVDGGPDENPRYEKVINEAIRTFKAYDLDALFIATNAPGRSAYNRVERRMAPLSRELCGVILPHDHFGSHLDGQGRTVDPELELRNFEHAGQTLAEIWNTVVIDKFRTKATYVTASHIRESHYFLQVTKCDDLECCSKHRGTYRNVFPRYIPAPLYLNEPTMKPGIACDGKFTSLLLRLRLDDSKHRDIRSGQVPYDLACPSVKELIPSRTCKLCGLYFASVKSMKLHKRICKVPHSALNDDFGTGFLAGRRNKGAVRVAARRQQERMVIWSSRVNDEHVDWVDEDDLDGIDIQEPAAEQSSTNINLNIWNLNDHMQTPWVDDFA